MLGIAIDAVVLVFLLKIINEDDIGFGMAIVVALVASIGTSLLAYGLASVMGIAGVVVAAAIAAAVLGVAVAALYGVEMKRAFVIGGLFMVAHICVAVSFQILLH